jgi:hypothetical protein
VVACINNIWHLAVHLVVAEFYSLSQFMTPLPSPFICTPVNCRKYIILGAFFKCPTQRLRDAYMGNLALVGNTRSKADVCKALMIAYQGDNVNIELVRNICESYHQALINICYSHVRMYR